MTTLLVTGGAGFIGGNYVLRTLEQDPDCKIVNLDLLTYAGNLETLAPLADESRHVFVHGDIGDAALVAQLMEQYEPDAVVNFAAESHVDRSIDGPAAFVHTNVVGTLNLIERAREWWRAMPPERAEQFRFLHVSTDEVYGSLGETGAFTEQTAYAPNSPYAASKAASDHLVRAFHHTFGLPVLTTNCSNNYGPYQFPEKLIPLIIHNALAGKELPVYGDGRQVRDWLFVHDHVDAINQVLKNGRVGEVYNIGGMCERANIEVVEAICDILDARRPAEGGESRRGLIRFVADRPGHDRRYAIDCSKLCGDLGWKPSVDFETGLARTVDWYLENEEWVKHVQDGTYQGERLGLGDSPA
jgi:dTDP-glucose 4,6-dehydratase